MSTREQSAVKGPSVGTIVWGVVIVAVAGLLLGSRLGWFAINPGLAAVAILVIAGLGLIVGGGLAAARNRKPVDGAVPPSEAPRRNPYETPDLPGDN